MTPRPEIRPLGPDDSVAELTALLHRAYAALGAMGLNYTAVDQSEEMTRKRIAGATCLVAASGGVLVGTIVFRPPAQTKGSPWLDRPEVASLAQFGVLPEQQRTGVGSRLMAAVERLPSKRAPKNSRSTPPCRRRISSATTKSAAIASSSTPSGAARSIAA